MLPLLAAAGGAAVGGLSHFLNRQKNPIRNARPYLDQIPGIGEQYYNPYIQQGQQAGQQLGQQYGSMAEDPQAFLEQLMQGYKPTTGYNYRAQKAMQEARAASAATGTSGSSEDERRRAELINSLLGEDMQQYINNVRGIQNTGLEGQHNIYNTGYDASGNLAGYLGSALSNRGDYESVGQNWKNQNRSNLFNSLLQGGASGAMAGYGAQQGGQQGQFNFMPSMQRMPYQPINWNQRA